MKRFALIIGLVITAAVQAATCGPIADDTYGYKAYWYPMKVDDTSYYFPVAYKIGLPKNYDSETSYPLVIFLHGSGEVGNDNSHVANWTNPCRNMTSYNGGSNAWNDANFACISLALQCPSTFSVSCGEFTSDNYLSPYWRSVFMPIYQILTNPWKIVYNYNYRGYSPIAFEQASAVVIVNNLLFNPSFTFYTKSDCSAYDESLTLNIDTDRVYLVGFSLGAYQVWGLMEAMRDVLAGAIALDGAPNMVSYDSYYSTLGTEAQYCDIFNSEDEESIEWCKVFTHQIEKICHIPVFYSMSTQISFSVSECNLPDFVGLYQEQWNNQADHADFILTCGYINSTGGHAVRYSSMHVYVPEITLGYGTDWLNHCSDCNQLYVFNHTTAKEYHESGASALRADLVRDDVNLTAWDWLFSQVRRDDEDIPDMEWPNWYYDAATNAENKWYSEPNSNDAAWLLDGQLIVYRHNKPNKFKFLIPGSAAFIRVNGTLYVVRDTDTGMIWDEGGAGETTMTAIGQTVTPQSGNSGFRVRYKGRYAHYNWECYACSKSTVPFDTAKFELLPVAKYFGG